MPRFIDFTAQNGAPVSIRPDQVCHLRGYARTDRETGEVVDHVCVVMTNRDEVFVRGSVAAIKAAIETEIEPGSAVIGSDTPLFGGSFNPNTAGGVANG